MTDNEESILKRTLVRNGFEILLMLIIQSVGIIWWASNLSAKVEFQTLMLRESQSASNAQIAKIEGRLERLENQLIRHP